MWTRPGRGPIVMRPSLPGSAPIDASRVACTTGWSRESRRGTGRPNLFGFRAAVAAQILADLRRGGLALDQLERAADALAEHDSALSEPSILLINGRVDVVADASRAAGALERAGLTLAYNTGH